MLVRPLFLVCLLMDQPFFGVSWHSKDVKTPFLLLFVQPYLQLFIEDNWSLIEGFFSY
ncbi:hypothetical protein HanPSC8_Chr14g0600641 [Helianthus annuus]|nr:hypothetical protein HanPSC8_Chr14g0600641 [Helianthus annuus]